MRGGGAIVILTTYLITSYNCLGISSKLDFGDSQSPKIVSSGSSHHYRVVPTVGNKDFKREDSSTSQDFDGLGVVCSSGGCNKTKSSVEESKDSIKTDVVVHVKTSVDLNKNKTNYADETPDIPVVVGVGGSTLDSTVDRRFHHQRPLVVTNIDEEFGPASFTPSSQFKPSTSYSTLSPHNHPNYYPNYNTQGLDSDNVYVEETNVAAQPRVDISIKTLPPITLTMSEDGRRIKEYSYKVNGVEMHVPYFEPSFNNHYFQENPPPQLVWYPKRQGIFNPVEFKYSQKPKFLPSLWRQTTPKPTYNIHHHHTGDDCKCNENNNNRGITGLQWNSNRRSYDNNRGDPGTQINDKLAPLNK